MPFNISIKNPNDTNATNFNFDINYYYLDENRLSSDRVDGNFSGQDIELDFKDNNVTGSSSSVFGGGVLNKSTAPVKIHGDFIQNSAVYDANIMNYASYGGAIFNDKNAIITEIVGDFIGNHSDSQTAAIGGAIYNKGEINSINGNFYDNYTKANMLSNGGAILNEGTIANISGVFVGNSADYRQSNFLGAMGGAISNIGIIDNISGVFIGNSAIGSGTAGVMGGAVYNNAADIGKISADFIGNYTINNSYGFFWVLMVVEQLPLPQKLMNQQER